MFSLAIFSVGCTATSCLISEASIAENSKKYSNVVHIKTIKEGGNVNVIVEAPTQLNGKVLESIFLQKKIFL